MVSESPKIVSKMLSVVMKHFYRNVNQDVTESTKDLESGALFV